MLLNDLFLIFLDFVCNFLLSILLSSLSLLISSDAFSSYSTTASYNSTSSHSSPLGLLGILSFLWSLHINTVGFRTTDLYAYTAYPNLASGCWSTITNSFYTDMNLSFIGVSLSLTGSLASSDIAHHHLAIGVLLISLSIQRNLTSTTLTRYSHSTSYDYSAAHATTVTLAPIDSNALLAINLFLISSSLFMVSFQIYNIPSYPYLNFDHCSPLLLLINHLFIASIIMTGSLYHFSLLLQSNSSLSCSTDQYSYSGSYSFMSIFSCRVSHNRYSLLSHLSFVTLFLGFHTLLIYMHNDSLVSFGSTDKQILIDQLFFSYIVDQLESVCQ
jgi:photosystem I P700 chlorophyll a apoprotein A2